MEIKDITYHDINLKVIINLHDPSGNGCISEIVERDEYSLYQFRNVKDKVFIDIGANIGVATVIMALLNPESVVYSFEPIKEVYDILCKNIEINNIKNVISVNCAISNKTDTVILHKFLGFSGASTICADQSTFNNHYGSTSETTVICLSFDEFIEDRKIDNIHLLKIDCEGAEYDILYDSKHLKCIDNMVGEFHDLEYNKTPRNECIKLQEYCQQYIKGIIKLTFLKI